MKRITEKKTERINQTTAEQKRTNETNGMNISVANGITRTKTMKRRNSVK